MTLSLRGDRGLPAGLLALPLAALGGAAMAQIGLPLAWLLGAMFATTGAALAGLPVAVPDRWRAVMIAVLGVLLGSWITRELVHAMTGWTASLVLLPVYILAVGALTYGLLRRWARLDPVTAWFAAAPGGLSEMILSGEREGGDSRTIALLHTVRLFLVVASIPLAIQAAGVVRGPGLPPAAWPPPGELAALVAAGGIGLWIGGRLRIPAGPLVGPLVASATLHLAGLVTAAPPREAVIAAQIVVGASIGVRFTGVRAHELARLVVQGAATTLVMLATTGLIAALLHLALGLPLAATALAFVPGGLAEMSLIALALHADPAFVAAHHIVRIALVVGLATVLLRRLRPLLR
jgi:membrane AbrB-like protein